MLPTSPPVCPAAIADTFPNGAGAGATLVESRQTTGYQVTVCENNGSFFYYGVSLTNASLSITLPAMQVGTHYIARNGGTTYDVGPQQLEVTDGGQVVVDQAFVG